jgi:isoquinoline 1-oxidoreductase alpha subunit
MNHTVKAKTIMIRLKINNNDVTYHGDESMPLLWYLRDHAKLVGTKFGCGIGACGACSVHINGKVARSCSVPMSALNSGEVKTIEGLKENDQLHPVQRVWIEDAVPQCGYCQAGQIMAVIDFLETNPTPTDDDIDQNLSNICRCGTYTRMRAAIHRAATLMNKNEVN